MEDNIFSKIVRGEIPCHRIYEDEITLAFLDIHPVQPGHVLVIPKQQVEFVWDLDDALYAAVMNVTKKIALHMREILDAPYISARVVGVDVPHAHVHLIPFSESRQLKTEPDMSAEPDHAALAAMANRLAFES